MRNRLVARFQGTLGGSRTSILGFLLLCLLSIVIATIAKQGRSVGRLSNTQQQAAVVVATHLCRSILGTDGIVLECSALSSRGKTLRQIVRCRTIWGEYLITINERGKVAGMTLNSEPDSSEKNASPRRSITSLEAIWVGRRFLTALHLQHQNFSVSRVVWKQDVRWELRCRCHDQDSGSEACRLLIDADTGRPEYCYIGK
jgi:hypothetical protein